MRFLSRSAELPVVVARDLVAVDELLVGKDRVELALQRVAVDEPRVRAVDVTQQVADEALPGSRVDAPHHGCGEQLRAGMLHRVRAPTLEPHAVLRVGAAEEVVEQPMPGADIALPRVDTPAPPHVEAAVREVRPPRRALDEALRARHVRQPVHLVAVSPIQPHRRGAHLLACLLGDTHEVPIGVMMCRELVRVHREEPLLLDDEARVVDVDDVGVHLLQREDLVGRRRLVEHVRHAGSAVRDDEIVEALLGPALALGDHHHLDLGAPLGERAGQLRLRPEHVRVRREVRVEKDDDVSVSPLRPGERREQREAAGTRAPHVDAPEPQGREPVRARAGSLEFALGDDQALVGVRQDLGPRAAEQGRQVDLVERLRALAVASRLQRLRGEPRARLVEVADPAELDLATLLVEVVR